jgi:glycosyltransferase involved in cell wall biosynthesis
MKIMLLVPHLSDGGGERIAADLSCSLNTDDLVLVVFEKKFSYPYKGRVISLDRPVDRRSVFTRAVGFANRLFQFSRVLRQERPDVVLSFMGEANLINAFLAKRPIVTIHNHLSSFAEVTRDTASKGLGKARSRFEAVVHRMLIRRLFKRATVVAVASAVRKELVEYFKVPERQVVVISNAVNASAIQDMTQVAADCPWPADAPVVVTAGRLTAVKGQWHLIRAFAESRKRIPCHLAILGAGELEGYLRGLAHELGIASHVSFLGWQENPFKYMSRTNLFVLPSLSEAVGLALLEAMACGLPVVAAECPGELREILAPGTKRNTPIVEPEYAANGILVPAFDAEMRDGDGACTPQEQHLAAVIAELLEDPSLSERYRKASLSRVRDFDHRAFVEKYQRLVSGNTK